MTAVGVLLFCSLYAIQGVEGGCSSLLTGTSAWPGNMGGTLVLASSVAYTNYTLKLSTDIPLTNIVFYTAIPTPTTGTSFTVVPMSYFSGVVAGGSLSLGFQISFAGPITPTFTSVVLNNGKSIIDMCTGASSAVPATTTNKPATTTTTTGKPTATTSTTTSKLSTTTKPTITSTTSNPQKTTITTPKATATTAIKPITSTAVTATSKIASSSATAVPTTAASASTLANPSTTGSSTGSCSSSLLNGTSVWTGNMVSNLLLPVNSPITAFSLNINTDISLTNVVFWTANVTPTAGTSFTVTPMSFFSGVSAGGVLSLGFQISFNGAKTPSFTSIVLTTPTGSVSYCTGSSNPAFTTAKPTTAATAPSTGRTTTKTATAGTGTTAARTTLGGTTTAGGTTNGGTTNSGTTAAFNGYRPNHVAKYDYKTALSYSLLFYEAQRSGKLPSDNRIKWRGDSALTDLIQGGYYDAGDYVKFGFPMAGAATIIAWSAVSFPNGYSLAGQTTWAARCIQWFTDYFIAAHTAATTLVGQIGDGNIDHNYWGRAEQMTMSRPAFSITPTAPGSDLAGETAAALAAASIFFLSQGNSSYADSCLTHARQLLDFADQYRGLYSTTISNAGSFYASSGYNDELVWAAAWVAKASGRVADVTRAVSLYNTLGGPGNTPQFVSWDDKWAMVHLLMYDITRGATYLAKVNSFVSYVLTLPKTPKGLVWSAVSAWGSLRYANNYAMFMLQAARLGIQEKACVDFAESQLNYALGDTGHSFVVGFGVNPPLRCHHAGASCGNMPATCDWSNLNSPNPNPQVLYGALVGGPDSNDNWSDDRSNYQTNEVAVDYNAGFQGALAGIIQRFY